MCEKSFILIIFF